MASGTSMIFSHLEKEKIQYNTRSGLYLFLEQIETKRWNFLNMQLKNVNQRDTQTQVFTGKSNLSSAGHKCRTKILDFRIFFSNNRKIYKKSIRHKI